MPAATAVTLRPQMDAEGLPTGFVELIRQERTRVLPCVGAGLSIPAGIRDLAANLSQAAAERGTDAGSGGLASVVSSLESVYGVEETQVLVAQTVSAIPVQPTPTQKALALCPAGIVVTFNYDDCLERAARAVGREPVSLVPDTAEAFRAPGPNELVVLHLHGIASEPSSIVLPGRTTERLAANELFMRLLTYLWARHVVIYFGFSFAPTEVHLLEALDWLARELRDADKQRLLLREFEVSQRHEELAPLLANPLFEIVPYPDTSDHRAVHQAALLLGPRNEPAPDNVSAQVPEPVPFYEPAALLEVEPGADPSAVQAETFRADWGMGTDWVTVAGLLDSGRAVVSAPPGMGKTQLLRVAGRESLAARRALLSPLRELPGLLDDDEDPRRAFARLVAAARAFDATTPVPTRERLETSSYIILLDGLDEVPPGRRPEVIDAVLSAVQRWPQHGYVVTTRPTVEAVRLVAAGFRSLRIVLSDGWGARYLERRGVPGPRLADLRERAPTASNLLSIPTYAAAIGERLVRGDELTDQPIDLLLDPVRTMASSEAQKQGKPLASYLAWLQRLAVGLELRGRNQATTGELAALPGPEVEDAATTRERLVQAALLNDVPDRAEFPQRTVQEALCADALLRCTDVAKAVRAVAAADLGGEEVLRGDIEHCLDQVWTNAAAEQRSALRDLDAVRWARTIAADCTDDEAEWAFDIIWTWHQQRRVWMNWAARGQLRGAQEAVQLLAAVHPDVVRRRQQELIDATRASEPASRGNAVEVLRRLGRDEDTATWLLPLLSDDNDVVRREAAQASANLGVTEALPVLYERFHGLTDELEADACGRALITLTSDADLVRVAELLSQNGRVWSRLGEELTQRLTLSAALVVLRVGVAAPEEQLTLLRRILEQHSPETWGSHDVEMLAESLIRHDVQSYEVDGNLLATIVRRHPEAALRGIRNGAQVRDMSWTHLFFVEQLPDELLRSELDGPLAEAYSLLLERKADRAARAEEVRETGGTATRRAARPGGEPSSLGRDLDEGRIGEDRVPNNPLVWPVEDLTGEQRERLTSLVDAWWPDRPLSELIQHAGGGIQSNNGAVAAVCAAAALDLPLSDERWLDVLAAPGVMILKPDTVTWLRRHHRPEVDERAASILRATEDEWHLHYAIGAFAPLARAVALAFIERLHIINDPLRFAAVLQSLVSAGYGELFDQFDDAVLDQPQRDAVLDAKAAAGDVDAQLTLVNEALANVQSGESGRPFAFADAVRDDRVVEPLRDLLALLGPSGGLRDDLQRSAVRALAATRSLSALRAYDRLLQDPSPDAAFFWYPRQELAQTMATETVLDRLPQAIAEVPAVVEEQGWNPDSGNPG